MNTPSPSDIKALEHLLGLVKNGYRSGCSSGERAAAKLATCMMENCSRLDDLAIEGLKLFIDGCIQNPTTTRDLVGAFSKETSNAV